MSPTVIYTGRRQKKFGTWVTRKARFNSFPSPVRLIETESTAI
ncbi:hypothetical protein L248_1755 [Schleiferilactobacillus shenzhenensis LY-73]|uniref:Uncharacterized protein n=1 Tax=Schleiferilactobacillus shenzhenensis LY-73 TaxID=1231336 RepID=U4TGN2_9LACO|nr:hypothetical protein L248_1755 [Schleiferilactobacillus shenzhenensis LY-73]